MKAKDLVLSIIALNPTYNYQITNPRSGLDMKSFVKDVCDSAPHPVLEYAQIRPVGGNSDNLDDAISSLTRREFFGYWRGNTVTWTGSYQPGEYYHTEIKPNLKDEQANSIEQYAKSLR
jgi:hypothetical protein|tara:strand:- start:2 stop:358 length:357 start_codon:yes stop_codon:yes gene_type:complete